MQLRYLVLFQDTGRFLARFDLLIRLVRFVVGDENQHTLCVRAKVLLGRKRQRVQDALRKVSATFSPQPSDLLTKLGKVRCQRFAFELQSLGFFALFKVVSKCDQACSSIQVLAFQFVGKPADSLAHAEDFRAHAAGHVEHKQNVHFRFLLRHQPVHRLGHHCTEQAAYGPDDAKTQCLVVLSKPPGDLREPLGHETDSSYRKSSELMYQ